MFLFFNHCTDLNRIWRNDSLARGDLADLPHLKKSNIHLIISNADFIISLLTGSIPIFAFLFIFFAYQILFCWLVRRKAWCTPVPWCSHYAHPFISIVSYYYWSVLNFEPHFVVVINKEWLGWQLSFKSWLARTSATAYHRMVILKMIVTATERFFPIP